ncbi:cytochrome P450 family protein [Ceratobasidium sp. AG-Ba]|nr:cytochrome P450 family protein [Ceratobasidium sp. AG-Ba]
MTVLALDPNAADEPPLKMMKQARLSMQRLVHNPEGVVKELQWMAAAIVLSSVYGYEASHPHDDLVDQVEMSMSHMSEAAVPKNFYVNTLPWMIHIPSWIPGAGWKRKAKEWRAAKDRSFNRPLEWTRSQMSSGRVLASMSKTLLTNLATDETQESDIQEAEDTICLVTGTLYSAAVHTTVAVAHNFILAMLHYPEVQRKIQVELDAVLHGNRLPELDDREALPYLSAVIKEVMRWRPVVPMDGNPGVAHASTKDDIHRGLFIPKGAIVAISNNPEIYPNPQAFNPDRFLDPKLPLAPVFGLGRR